MSLRNRIWGSQGNKQSSTLRLTGPMTEAQTQTQALMPTEPQQVPESPATADENGFFPVGSGSYDSFVGEHSDFHADFIDSPGGTIGIAGKLSATKVSCHDLILLPTGQFSGDVHATGVVSLCGHLVKSVIRAEEILVYRHATTEIAPDNQLHAKRIGVQIGAKFSAVFTQSANNNPPDDHSSEWSEEHA